MSLSDAEAHAPLGLPVPRGAPQRALKQFISRLNWFFLHHQVAFNEEIVRSLNESARVSAALTARLDTHTAQLEDLNGRFEAMNSRIDGLVTRMDAVDNDLWAALGAQANQAEALSHDLWEAAAAQAAASTGQLDDFTRELWLAISAQSKQLETLSGDLWEANAAQASRFEDVSRDVWAGVKEIWDAVLDAREDLDEKQVALQIHVDLMQRQAFARHHEGIGPLRSELVEMSLQIAEIHKELEVAAAEMRRRRGAVDALLDEVRRSLPELPAADDLEKLPRAMESMYPEFEEAFRGSTLHVSEIVREYLPDVLALDRQGPVVDLGSGRGEWLEILKEAGVEAYGVDTSQDFAGQCGDRGLKVVLADAIEHLESLTERSVSAITAFHLVEHLPIDQVIRLIDLSVRALRPGGLLIMETPNPENLIVGASSFYLDPSHLRPLPPGLLSFLVEARGFGDVETRLLHPNAAGTLQPPEDTGPWSSDLTVLVDTINSRLYGAQDYAVIGRRI